MKLFYSNTSPYARKTRLVLREKGLEQGVDEIPCDPFQEIPGLRQANPLGRVPTLVLDDGSALFDSPVICQYLDSLAAQPRLIPAAGPGRWATLRWEALADGVLDAAYDLVMERRRPAAQQSARWIGHWTGEIHSSLGATEQQLDTLPETLCLSHLALAAALGYLDFRMAELDWRGACPNTSAWFAEFGQRPAMRATQPA